MRQELLDSDCGESTMLYETFDPEIVELCKAVNEFPGVETTNSCQGYIGGHREGESWRVYFCPILDRGITPEAYNSIEFLVWITNCGEAASAGLDVTFRMKSFPPIVNVPGRSLYFVIEGKNRHPDELAKIIRERRERDFFITDRQSA